MEVNHQFVLVLVVVLAYEHKVVNGLYALLAATHGVSYVDEAIKVGIKRHVTQSQLRDGRNLVLKES